MADDDVSATLRQAASAQIRSDAIAFLQIALTGDLHIALLCGEQAPRLRRRRRELDLLARYAGRTGRGDSAPSRASGRARTHRVLLLKALQDNGCDERAYDVPRTGYRAWALAHGHLPDESPSSEVAALAALGEDDFLAVVLADLRRAENPSLCDDALVERWLPVLSTATNVLRLELGETEQRASTTRGSARNRTLSDLEALYQDLAVACVRRREAERALAAFRERLVRIADAALASLDLTNEPARHEGRPQHPSDAPASYDAPTTAPRSEPFALPPIGADTLVVAVDASLGAPSATCGFGWAAEDGRLGHGTGLAVDSTDAETLALCLAAQAPEFTGRRLMLLSDCEHAVRTVAHVLAGSVDPAELRCGPGTTPGLTEALAVLRDRVPSVSVHHVPGHAGHELNEAADTLARLGLHLGNGRSGPGRVAPVYRKLHLGLRRRWDVTGQVA
nr:RNase H family protein [Streptomyces sp. SID3343]